MKNLFIYLLGMLFTLYVMVMYTEPYFFTVFLVEAGFLVCSAVIVFYMRMHVNVKLLASTKVVKAGEMLPVTLLVDNRGILPLGNFKVRVSCRNTMGGLARRQWVCLYANARARAQVTFHLESEYCGMVEVHIEKLKVSDFFRLFSLTKKCRENVLLPVFPEIYPVTFEVGRNIRDFIGESDVFSKDKSGDDPSEVFDVRPFRPGDRMQQIHWKLTARSDDFMVKEFSRPLGYPVVVFLDFSRDEDMKKDQLMRMCRVLEAGLSMSLGLVQAQCWHYIAWCAPDLTAKRFPVESADDVYGLMEQLLGIRVHEKIDDCRMFYGQNFGRDTFNTFLSVNMTMTIEKDGEIYEERGLDRHTLSGKNFIL